ncbi:hypothetical protein Dpoa2040_000757 [Dickeya sp. CFBP 2040]|uniref:hypothetical protein n=1 Tax=Dickeya TaxID=204037 RepID=UPI001446394B|nr:MULTISPECIES: hypothetical protein [Dickeya]MBP2845423.1 hypothetical protein [Dickeya oryzae]NKI73554.1 hypothetical protein [Dickeya sp. CFBP 2040]
MFLLRTVFVGGDAKYELLGQNVNNDRVMRVIEYRLRVKDGEEKGLSEWVVKNPNFDINAFLESGNDPLNSFAIHRKVNDIATISKYCEDKYWNR